MESGVTRRGAMAITALGATLLLSLPTRAQNAARPVFFSGNVVLENGTLPPEPVLIKMRCQRQEQPQGYTLRGGRFAFQVGRRRDQTPNDASQRSPTISADFAKQRAGQNQANAAPEYDLTGCSLRGHLDGYTSSVIELTGRRISDNSAVGTIVLSPNNPNVPAAISLATLAAPKKARRAYEDGLQAFAKQQFSNAEKRFRRALKVYPDYAEAWQELGVALYVQDRDSEARDSFTNAVALDPNLVKSYLFLSFISAREQDWPNAASYSDRLLELEPDNYPTAYYYNAVAYYNLQDHDKALVSAERAVELDPGNQIPLARQLLGIMLSQKGNFVRAAEQFRSFIAHAIPGTDLTPTRQMLASAERGIAQSASAQRSSR